MKVKSFGTSAEEETIQDKIKSREIVQSILQYGVNQKQIEQIIYLFAMELENVELMKGLTKTINWHKEKEKLATIF